MATQHNLSNMKAAVRGRRPAFRFWQEYNRDQKLFVIEAMLINSATVITGGVFLTGLLVMMGATDFMVGLVSSSGGWSLMLSLVSSIIVESVKRKKALMTGALLAFRLLTTLPVFLPAVLGMGMPSALVAAVMLIAGNMVFSIFNTGFYIFFMDSLPVEGRVSYIYTRMFILRVAYTVTSLAMGFLLDFMNKSYAGFIVVFCMGLAIGIADVVVITMIRGRGGEGDGSPREGLRLNDLGRRLIEPLKNRRYVHYLAFTFAFFFFTAMSSAYTSLYQYKYLHLSVAFISIYTTCTYVIMIAVTRRWARIEEKFGRLQVLVVCSVLMACEFFVYGFLTEKTLWLIVLSPVFSGLGSSGYWACALPYRYDLMPQEGKTVYEGWNGVIFGAAGLLGALVGGKLQGVLPSVDAHLLVFSKFQLVYFMSGALALLSSVLFWRMAKKDGTADP